MVAVPQAIDVQSKACNSGVSCHILMHISFGLGVQMPLWFLCLRYCFINNFFRGFRFQRLLRFQHAYETFSESALIVKFILPLSLKHLVKQSKLIFFPVRGNIDVFNVIFQNFQHSEFFQKQTSCLKTDFELVKLFLLGVVHKMTSSLIGGEVKDFLIIVQRSWW